MSLLFSPGENEARMKEEAAGEEDDDGNDSQDDGGDDDDDEGTITEFRFVPSDKAACKSEQHVASRSTVVVSFQLHCWSQRHLLARGTEPQELSGIQ